MKSKNIEVRKTMRVYEDDYHELVQKLHRYELAIESHKEYLQKLPATIDAQQIAQLKPKKMILIF